MRTITVPGDALLPQDNAPRLPSDLAFGDYVRVVPPAPPWRPDAAEASAVRKRPERFPAFDCRYWQVVGNGQHPTDTLSGWVNDPGPGTPVIGHGHGLDRVPPVVEFSFTPRSRKQSLPDFWQLAGAFVVSTRLRDLLLDADEAALVHKPIVMRDLDGALVDDDHHLMDVVRSLSAVDYANSIVDYLGPERHGEEVFAPRVHSLRSVRFCDDLDPRHQVFRQTMHHPPGWGAGLFIAEALKARLERVKPSLRNLSFRELYWGCP